MKIVMFGHKRMPSRDGGVEVVVEELSTRMAKAGHEVTCCNRGGRIAGPARTEYENVRLITVPTLDRRGLAAVSSSFFAALYGAFCSADVVHIHGEGPAFMCWLPKLFGKRVIVTVHGLDWQRQKWKGGFGRIYIHAGERVAAHLADEVITLSRNAQRYFLDKYGRKTRYIPNGATRPVSVAADQIVREFDLHRDEYILYLGRLVPEKGVHDLIAAFKSVDTGKKLVIAGHASDTAEYAAGLKAAAASDPRILFTGHVEGRVLEELYSNAYVYVLPSELEGMSLSLLEAMSYGNCCVVSDIPECTEVVEDKAIVIPRGDPGALGRCLQSLCRDPDIVACCRREAADYICGKYRWDDVVNKTLELYHEDIADQ